ncbi:MAG: L-aspartate oxidase [Planctomycetota bacterium]
MLSLEDRRYLIPFRATLLPQIFCDVLVVGEGAAGCSAALAASQQGGDSLDIIVTGKGKAPDTNTYWAQGGIAAVLDETDSVEEHIADTLTAGAGLCDEPAVRKAVAQGPDLMRRLIDNGLRLDRDADGSLKFGKEGGHSQARIVHTDGDATGKSLSHSLINQVDAAPNIRRFEQCFILDLITVESSPPRVVGAITHHPKYGLQVIWAHATILAAGGCGQVYRESTNPKLATGDGLAMAYRAGAQLMDMAFVQFHPTTLYVAGASRSLITEAVRGEGAHLVDRDGYRFMPDYDDRAELAPRDIVSRSILHQMAKTGHSHVFLDVRPLGIETFNQRFPGIAKLLHNFEIDPAKSPIPVHPSAHYMVGGIATDLDGRTNLPGLYAAGEAAATGLHGANRLASNSLLEGLVFGDAAGRAALEAVDANGNGSGRRALKIISDIRPSDRSELDLGDVRSSLRSVMWRHVSIEREGQHLAEVQDMFAFWARYTLDKIFDEAPGWEVQNLLTVGSLITRSAAWRKESRGTHYRLDYPTPNEAFHLHDLITRGQPEPTTRPVLDPIPSP